MKKFILLLFILFSCISVKAAEYNFLVLPMSIQAANNINLLNVNAEELLAQKIINQIVMTNLAYTPDIKTIKETLKKQNNENNLDIKSIMVLFNIQNAIVITSKTEIRNTVEEKKFWSKLELPMVTNNGTGLKVTTMVELINNNKTLWKNIYYKNINFNDNNINYNNHSLSKMEILNNYYDKLAIEIIKEIKETDKNIFKLQKITDFSPAVTNFEDSKKTEIKESPNNIKEQEEVKPVSNENMEVKKEAEKIIPINFSTGLKPNLEFKEDVKPQTKTKFIDKVKNTVKLKDDNIKQEIDENNIRNKNNSEKSMYIIPEKTTVKDLTPISDEKITSKKEVKWTDKLKIKYNNFIKKFKKSS